MRPAPPPKDRSLRAVFEAMAADDSLTIEPMAIGKRLLRQFKSTQEWRTITQKALHPGKAQENVSRAIRRLIDAGYIERRPSPDDKRQRQYRVGKKWQEPERATTKRPFRISRPDTWD